MGISLYQRCFNNLFFCIDYHLPFFTLVNKKKIAWKENNNHKLQTTDVNHVQVAEQLVGQHIRFEAFHLVVISLDLPTVDRSPYSCQRDARYNNLSLPAWWAGVYITVSTPVATFRGSRGPGSWKVQLSVKSNVSCYAHWLQHSKIVPEML